MKRLFLIERWFRPRRNRILRGRGKKSTVVDLQAYRMAREGRKHTEWFPVPRKKRDKPNKPERRTT